ncbi:glutaminase [Gordonia shandongensis]|uniref:glutaminase n=1 Tax=Gordonia shandongensis TaxID=376351 RepID=UPI00040D2740|nr:glutaminase [Gordonia shandongensis]
MFDDVQNVAQRAYTGSLPTEDQVQRLVESAHRRYAEVHEGFVADYIPVLADADPDSFGLVMAGVTGQCFATGDSDTVFSIQSISKAFVFALAVEAIGHEEARYRVGVNNTGMGFNSVVAVEMNDGSPMNPMVNPGAIVTSGLVPGTDIGEKWAHIHEGLSAFAGRELDVDEDVYRSEMANNERNRAIAHLLTSYGRLDVDPNYIVDAYTRQCSLQVTAADIAVMGGRPSPTAASTPSRGNASCRPTCAGTSSR